MYAPAHGHGTDGQRPARALGSEFPTPRRDGGEVEQAVRGGRLQRLLAVRRVQGRQGYAGIVGQGGAGRSSQGSGHSHGGRAQAGVDLQVCAGVQLRNPRRIALRELVVARGQAAELHRAGLHGIHEARGLG